MRVRAGTIDDRAFILSLAERFAEFELPPWRSRADVAAGTRKQLDDALASMNERSTFVVAEEEDGTQAGFAWVLLVRDFYTMRDIAKISEIAVTRDGSGAGSALMDAAEAWARSHGCELLVLNVMSENTHARRFYDRRGFAPEYTMLVKELPSK